MSFRADVPGRFASTRTVIAVELLLFYVLIVSPSLCSPMSPPHYLPPPPPPSPSPPPPQPSPTPTPTHPTPIHTA